ncbi:MAG: ATP-binding protein [Novosphingobium sp.]
MSTPPPSAAAPVTEDIQVGSFFLETLTTGMYEDPFHCIREYVQNGFDAIQDAIRAGDLAADDGRILISIGGSPRAPSLSIRDNGTGIPAARAYSTLVSLGASRKTPALHAGFRGIGRLAGIAYCTTLRFTTKARGENVATIVDYDCGRVRGYFSPGADPVDVRDVVRACVSRSTIEADAQDHYTEVEMIQLVNLGTEFVDLDKLQPYLRQVCPVEYPDTFDFADRVRSLAAGVGETLPVVHVETRQKRERVHVLKPYKNSYPTGRKNVFSRLHDVEVFSSKEHGWFGWIGVSNFPGEIVDETAAGVRFRIKNIQIGNAEIIESLAEELTAAGTERRLQPWAVGEIFVTNSQVVPNARRDGFEDSAAWRTLRRDIKEQVVRRIIKLVRGASSTRTAMKNLSDALKRLSGHVSAETMTAERRDQLEAEIKRHLQTLATPERLLGADPKEVSALTSSFKELRERLAKIRITEPPREEPADSGSANQDATDTNTETQRGEPQTAPESDAAEGGVGEPHQGTDGDGEQDETVLTIIHNVLRDEVGEAEATRLTNLIGARLADAGF